MRTTAGPPVWKRYVFAPSTAAPDSSRKAGLTVKLQRTPGGTSRLKSNTQLRSSAQRPLPASLQAMSNGAGARGSPKRMAASEKVARTWRTLTTSPCGENWLIAAAGASTGKASSAGKPPCGAYSSGLSS